MSNFNDLNKVYPKASGSFQFSTAASGNNVLTAVKSALHKIYIRKIVVTIKTDAAQNMTFQDDAGTPVVIAVIPNSPGVVQKTFDFGTRGTPLTRGQSFQLTFSAAGLAGHVEWEGYMSVGLPTN